MLTASAALGDEALVPGLVQQDEAAVAALLDRYWERAYRVALQMVQDPATAEDVAQETFVRVLKAVDRFDADRAFRPWFFRILSNTAGNHLRSARRREARESRATHDSTSPDPEVGLAEREEAELVREHLGKLKPTTRHALVLRYFEGMSLAEVADSLGCPQGTVSSRIRRGLESLRRSLEPALTLGATPLVDMLRTAVQAVPAPPPPGGAELAAAMLQLPALDVPADAPSLDGMGPSPADAVAAGPAPAPPSPSHLLELAHGSTQATTGKSLLSGTLAPALLLLAVGGGGVVGGVALFADADTEPARAAASPQVAQFANPVALLANPRIALTAPAQLTAGDRVEAVAVISWPEQNASDLRVEATSTTPGLTAAAIRHELAVPGETARWTIQLTASQPGKAAFSLRATSGTAVATAQHQLSVRPPGRSVSLTHNAELLGPESVTRIRLDDRVSELREPSLALRVIPGLAAEVEMSLEGFARIPHGCFEQTTAATFPSALVLELAQADGDVSEDLVEKARAYSIEGAERLKRFQHSDGAFSIHGREPTSAWLTAVGLNELTHLSRVVDVDPSRILQATRALGRYQHTSGRFEARHHGVSAGEFAVTAYCADALHPHDPETASRSLTWIAEHAESELRSAYEMALAMRALSHSPDYRELVEALAKRIVKLAKTSERGVYWKGGATTTGTSGKVAAIETTALASQVLSKIPEHQALATDALRWLAASRRSNGFGGTQATVQALHAFQLGNWKPAEGVLLVTAGPGQPLAEIEIKPGATLSQTPLEDVSAASAFAAGVGLRFVGTGRLRAQLVIAGVIPWDAEGWSEDGEEEAVPSNLSIRIQRPSTARVGHRQRWTVTVENQTNLAIAAPMVEVGLPPGFALADTDGGLTKLIEAKHLELFELLGDRLVLYLPQLEPKAKASVPVDFLPTFVGNFTGGVLMAYPYYRSNAMVIQAPVQFEILPETATVPAPVVKPRPKVVAKAKPKPEPKLERSKLKGRPPYQKRSAPRTRGRSQIRIAWDSKLGKIELNDPAFPLRNGHAQRLLSRALYYGLPSLSKLTVNEDRTRYEFDLYPVKWSHGTPVTAHDFTKAWDLLRRTEEWGPYVSRDAISAFKAMTYKTRGNYNLVISVPKDTLNMRVLMESFPFLPHPPEPRLENRFPLVTNGPYQVARADGHEVELRRASGGGGGPGSVVVTGVDITQPNGFDLVWTQEGIVGSHYEDVGRVGIHLRLSGGRERRRALDGLRALQLGDTTEAAGVRLVGRAQLQEKPGSRAEVRDQERTTRSGAALTLGYTRPALRELALRLHSQLANRTPLELIDEPVGPKGAHLVLDCGVGGLPNGSRFFQLGSLPATAAPADGWLATRRQRGGRPAIDASGYLAYPPAIVWPDPADSGVRSAR